MTEMLGIALFIGFIHLTIGMTLKPILEKGIKSVSSILKIWLFFGETLILTKLFTLPVPFLSWFSHLPFFTLAIFGVGIPGGLIIILNIIEHKSSSIVKAVGNSIFEIFELFTKFLSNTISYSRIFALTLVHTMLFTAVFLISRMFYPYEVFVLFFGTIALVFLEALIVFIHTLRLHFTNALINFIQVEEENSNHSVHRKEWIG